MIRCDVIIAAAGSSKRMGEGVNKQYVSLCGEPVLARTIEAFERAPCAERIIIAAAAGDIERCKGIVAKRGFKKVTAVLPGGSTRQESVRNALFHIGEEGGIVLIHDGARPFVTPALTQSLAEAAARFGAACAAVPVKDTIKVAAEDGFVASTPERAALWQVQTPQAFQTSIIKKAHEAALKDAFTGTDDAALAERIAVKVKLVMGEYTNIKITTKEDLQIARAIYVFQENGL